MTETFTALYWDEHAPGRPETMALFRELGSRIAGTAALNTLLASDEVRARAMALEYYHASAALGRFGESNALDPLAVLVASTARTMLEEPAVDRGEDGALLPGANHASALLALVTLVEPSDAALLSRAPVWADPELRTLALLLATQVFDDSVVPEAALIRLLAGGAEDPSWSPDERGEALTTLVRGDTARAVALARRALLSPQLPLQISGALVLAEHDLAASRPRLERVVATWSDDAPYTADEVRDLLAP